MSSDERAAARSEAPPDGGAGAAAEGSGVAAFWEQLGTIALAVAIAIGIRAFVIEPFRIPSGSMFPTLLIGDHLFVNKFVYGIRIPFSERRLPGLREPERGDVVVFTVAKEGQMTFPADRRPDLPREEFVKRIIGLPGDRIEFSDGVIRVNDEPVAIRDAGEIFVDDAGRQLEVRDVSLAERSFRTLRDPRKPPRDPEPFTVEEGRYYVLGDNRDYSKDSRVWGTVRREELKGPAVVLYWSWDFNGGWLELLDPSTWWSAEMRWDRMGEAIR